MNDDSVTAPRKPAQAAAAEPPSSPASAFSWGHRIWNWLRGLLAMRTVSLRDDLEVALESENNGETADFTQSERTILKNVLELGEKRVEDVMVPRADIVAIEKTETLGVLV
ncbi:MAG: magnesium/cobalt efflux protein, partial [Devosia sp.]